MFLLMSNSGRINKKDTPLNKNHTEPCRALPVQHHFITVISKTTIHIVHLPCVCLWQTIGIRFSHIDSKQPWSV